ncbi:hypothetical protein WDV06_15300 [Streptomyces racemochromogenes]|uniref:Uncharacterized protein n=1 Tax=Streptomyces racemochromogenes TaxID=67353 RepID=A0ABW7PDI5_9ACTN
MSSTTHTCGRTTRTARHDNPARTSSTGQVGVLYTLAPDRLGQIATAPITLAPRPDG